MGLKGQQIESLKQAFLQAFPSKHNLTEMVKIKINENLAVIAGGDNLGEIVFNLIVWAESKGRLDELITKARESNSGNLELDKVAQELLLAISNMSRPAVPLNPFMPLGGRIENPSAFFDRKQELTKIFDILNSGASVIVVGDRGIGKSSLIHATYREAYKRLYSPRKAIYIDLQQIYDESDFYGALCDQAQIPFSKGYALTRALKDKRLLLILDEFEKMAWDGFTHQIRSQLRGLAEGGDASLRLVLAARNSLDHLFSDSDNMGMTSPLSNICIQVDIDGWNDLAAHDFIEAFLRDTPVRFTSTEFTELISVSVGHPQRLMRLCFELYNRYVESS